MTVSRLTGEDNHQDSDRSDVDHARYDDNGEEECGFDDDDGGDDDELLVCAKNDLASETGDASITATATCVSP